MTISSKDLYSLGYRYSWVHKHFSHIALDTYKLDNHKQYNQYKIEDIFKYINNYIGYCKNPIQQNRSKEMIQKLDKDLREKYSKNH